MSCSPPARTGRHRQRYEDQFRLVAGCIPFRFEKICQDSSCNLQPRLLVLMISSPNHNDLVFPKGGWEDDETVTEAACREALEEAGVKGILSEESLGHWEFRSKSSQNSCSLGGGCRGYMYAMEVTEELDSWPGQANYNRKWLTVDDAFKFCRYDWMREALLVFLSNRGTEETREALRRLFLSKDGTEETREALRRLLAFLSNHGTEETREALRRLLAFLSKDGIEETREALRRLLAFLSKDGTEETREELMECAIKPSGVLRPDECRGKCAVQG